MSHSTATSIATASAPSAVPSSTPPRAAKCEPLGAVVEAGPAHFVYGAAAVGHRRVVVLDAAPEGGATLLEVSLEDGAPRTTPHALQGREPLDVTVARGRPIVAMSDGKRMRLTEFDLEHGKERTLLSDGDDRVAGASLAPVGDRVLAGWLVCATRDANGFRCDAHREGWLDLASFELRPIGDVEPGDTIVATALEGGTFFFHRRDPAHPDPLPRIWRARAGEAPALFRGHSGLLLGHAADATSSAADRAVVFVQTEYVSPEEPSVPGGPFVQTSAVSVTRAATSIANLGPLRFIGGTTGAVSEAVTAVATLPEGLVPRLVVLGSDGVAREVKTAGTPVTDGFALAAAGDELYLVSAGEMGSAPGLEIQTFQCR